MQPARFIQLHLDKMLQQSRVWSVLRVDQLLQHLLTRVTELLCQVILDRVLISSKLDRTSIHSSQFPTSYSLIQASNMQLLSELLLRPGQQLILDSKGSSIRLILMRMPAQGELIHSPRKKSSKAVENCQCTTDQQGASTL